MPKRSILELALADSGIEVPSGSGAERAIACPNPHHPGGESTTPTCVVNIAKGTYWCHLCRGGGNAYTYLRLVLQWNEGRIGQWMAVNGFAHYLPTLKERHEAQDAADLSPVIVPTIPDTVTKNGKVSAIKMATYEYRHEDRSLAFVVVRYRPGPGAKRANPGMAVFTPCATGGLHACAPTDTRLPTPATRVPLYRLPELRASERERDPKGNRRQVWVVNDERSAEAVAHLTIKTEPPPPCTTVPYGFTLDEVDWSPLHGRAAAVFAAPGAKEKKRAEELAEHLRENLSCHVRLISPDPREPRNLADLAATGGFDAIVEWTRSDRVSIVDYAVEPPPPPSTPDAAPPEAVPPRLDTSKVESPLFNNAYFRVVGMADDYSVLFQRKTNSSLVSFPIRAMNAEMSLLHLAPLDWWNAYCGGHGLTKSQRAQIASALVEESIRRGYIKMHNAMGRGAFCHDGAVVWNMGDRLLTRTTESESLTHEVPLANYVGRLCIPGERIAVAHRPDVEDLRHAFASAVLSYRWLTANDGMAFLGWIVSAVIGGALNFRPMFWLTAPSSTGKSYVVRDILFPLFGPMLSLEGDITEAGLVGSMQSDSLPVCLDEFEPTKGRDEKYAAVMLLLRLASGGELGRTRAGSGGAGAKGSRHTPRFSCFISSIGRAVLSQADHSRFYHAALSPTPVPDWPSVDRSISNSLEGDKGRAIVTDIITHTGWLVSQVAAREKIIAELSGYNARQAKVSAALSVGASWLTGEEIAVRPWDESTATPLPDGLEAISTILLSPIRMAYGEEATLWTRILDSFYATPDGTWNGRNADAIKQVAQYGVKLGQYGKVLRVATHYKPLQRLLEKTRFATIDLTHALRSIEGATKSARRFKIGGVRLLYVEIPMSVLSDMGFVAPRPAGLTDEEYKHGGDDD